MSSNLCRVCNHEHEQGVKCPICGHIGKCKVLMLLKKNAPINQVSLRAFRIDVHASPILGDWSFSRLLREQIFALPTAMFGAPLFDNLDVTNACKHILIFVGDAPVGTARWSFTYDNGVEVALIEKFGLLDTHRRLGHGTKMLEYIIQDIATTSAEVGRDVFAIVASVRNNVDEPAYKLFLKCKFQPKAPEGHAQDSSIKMVLTHN
ncbi:hypothetical protein SPRG_10460 [Saprolegnia parasitica CBS 223.65]|uniref:N-acetyltransferase domain-containing protein n=1 Tax=Saprolegnia parasitica (strain CBS 223.65) TaxID=695850 RepID=A0A067CC32_SAPPC|nr:hypothetical protein SPRG_10460 [Saprolegnia parasitica CBS 223.65]KDO24382.1 hypothetical protein SPRG_10460 [Saprolegnia parasitica CBS 223.65]|eukprot:XP_012204975.1 hypothetical protein SPRG_10460 [Saprolegnia parasitica CBS 223.65]